MHFKTCLMQDGIKGVLNVRNKDRTFGKFSPKHTLVVCTSPQAKDKGLEKDSLPEPEIAQNIQLFTTFRVPFTVLRYESAEFWCFLLADLSVGVQTAARAPICSLLCRCSRITEKGVSLVDGQGRTERRTQVNRQEHLAPTVGHDLKHQSHHNNSREFIRATITTGEIQRKG